MTSTRLRVFAVFALGYFVSYLFRGVNLGFAPFLTRELGFTSTDLGTLTSLYFLGFAGAQIPGGVLLDHFGPRRATACVMLVAAAGALLFGFAHSLGAMMAGRLLIGIGVSVCLAGAFKANAQYFPVAQLTLVNGLVMAIGGLGGVAVGAPLSWLLSVASWRAISVGIAVLTTAVAALIWIGGPRARDTHHQASVLDQFRGTAHILRSRSFWKTATFSSLTQAVFYAMQSLWVGAFMRDVVLAGRLDAISRAASLVSVLGGAFIVGNIGFGMLARVFERRGVSVHLFSGFTMMLFVVVQTLLAMRAPLPAPLLWAAYGGLGGTGILTYAVLAGYFPPRMIGRVNTTFTLVIFVGIFAVQVAVGAALAHWPAVDGHYPAAAHQVVWLALIALQLAGAVWYFMPSRRANTAAEPAVEH
ncbi:MFS transporter [Paraburkholderia caballeronis]|uniref:MFS transporter n=1 Tax=Paraburkholderia caballeronis TaxID=416943 RepID=UPI001064E915|nr:MFS transporter [Paraburkholderia caballeronis]TDV11473.1 MFS transporter [Paraburkholderia caballeronis]TDV14663.1 MFS transporter [Paraburkholderia caballeronis]TDV23734.1 MFS transporter [Paraburkholderia caballeronis]